MNTPADPNQCSPNGIQGVHDVVMRKPYFLGDSTAVLTFGGAGCGLRSGLWTFVASSGYTQPTFVSISNPQPGNRDIFCSGHSVLGDGRAIVVGGDHGGTFDANKAYLFDPTQPEGQRWTLLGSQMAQFRWYPTINTIDDGHALAFLGDQFQQMVTFGGTAGSPQNDLDVAGLPVKAVWKTDQSALVHDSPSIPPTRYGHTLTFHLSRTDEQSDDRRMILFGGVGTNLSSPYNDIWELLREQPQDTTWKWTQLSPTSDPQGHGAPVGRYLHSAIISSANQSIYIYGGFDGTGAPRGDVWRLWWECSTPGCVVPTAWHWQWIADLSAATVGARAGHTAVYDETNNRMLVFGGVKDANGNPADNDVWALSLSNPSLGWVRPPLRTGRSSAKPAGRSGHAWAEDFYEAHTAPSSAAEYRVAMFGGKDATTTRSDLWFLWLMPFPSDSVEWEQPQGVIGPAPSPRAYHAAAYDPDYRRVLFYGGDTLRANLSGTDPTSQVWSLVLNEGGVRWRLVQLNGVSPQPSGRSKTAVLYDRRAIDARFPEKFGLHDGSGGQDAWTVLGNAWHPQDNYPFMFEMPSGKILDAGPEPDPVRGHIYQLDLNAGAWVDTVITDSGLLGRAKMGSAVMYRPGKVLRCGSRDSDQFDIARSSPTSDVLTYNLGSLTGWQGLGDALLRRNEPNLTVLPTGKVLATGGIDANTPRKEPQVWDPDNLTWSALLAPDPMERDYHSAAILLPDARVLSTGGQQDGNQFTKVTLFEPPYLFDANGSLATRPTVYGWPSEISYNNPFTIWTDRAATIKSACLIRPGAVTHAYNQDQRFVPLAIVRSTNSARLFATAPLNAKLAPPGDYLFFVVDSTAVATASVPSVANWIRVGSTAGLDLVDSVRAGIITDLTVTCDPTIFNNFIVSWSAPADDSNLVATGSASLYEIRTSSGHITEANWFSATLVTTRVPGTPRTLETMNVTGTSQGRYIRMRTKDDYNWWSGLSNEVFVQSLPAGQDCLGGGGMFAAGGGPPPGNRTQPASAAASLQPTLGATWSPENTLLGGATVGSRASDLLRLPVALAGGGGTYSFRVREAGGRSAGVDDARLLTVDHSTSVQVFMSGGKAVLGTRVAPVGVIDGAGVDVTSLVDGTATSSFAGDSGAALTVRLSSDSVATPDPIVIEASGIGSDSTGILLQVPDGGGWRTRARVHPRLLFDEIVVDSVATSRVRLRFLGQHQVCFVGRVARSIEQPVLQWAQLLSAQDSRLGDALSAVIRADTASATLAGPDTLMLSFAAPSLALGQVRDCFLAVDATPLSPVGIVASPLRGNVAESVPARFALWQNQPNPFSSSTTIRFDLPVGAMVKLEIFDVQGRRAKMVTNHYYPAGSQAAEWDRRDEAGIVAKPGVYLYRLTAGSVRDQKKMVLLP